MQNLLHEIARGRAERVAALGAAQGLALPERREHALVPFTAGPLLICEIKRRSPSRGDIRPGLDAVSQAAVYEAAGIRQISILTEEAHFGGALADLAAVKRRFPRLSLLRKDFLLGPEDVRVSHRAGADAILLIAALLEPALLREMHDLALGLGMTPLVELHDQGDAAKCRSFKPGLVGLNSRDLKNFRIDVLRPHKIRNLVDWPCRIVYESGIQTAEDALFALGSGFDGLLVGEAVVSDPSLIPSLRQAFGAGRSEAERRYGFWKRLYRRHHFGRPLVKICGITSRADAELAAGSGADMLGFVFAESARRCEPGLLEELAGLAVLKTAVVALEGDQPLPKSLENALERGLLDAIQFHGTESPAAIRVHPGYKALQSSSVTELDRMDDYGRLPCLIDAFSAQARGGTGRRISTEIVQAAAAKKALWLAGGLDPANIASIMAEHGPELVDLSSGVETSPGRKDPARLAAFFSEVQAHAAT